MNEMAPIAFGRYRLVERLGAGGMAQVFRAVTDEGTGSVVVKRMLPHLSGNRDFVRLLIDEARLSSRLHHPAIVRVHEFGDVSGEYYIAMEHVEGRNLATLLGQLYRAGRALPQHLGCHVVREVAAALAYAHALAGDDGRPLEIIHRDVSPSNILVSQSGVIKLLDFGIAKAANGIREEETRTGVVKGKVSYMSPEQADGRDVDRRSDIFALGVVFWECLTMRRLFRGTDDLHTLRLVREAAVEPPSRIVPTDGRVEAVVMKMLARDRDARYGSCEEIVAALAAIALPERADAESLRAFLGALGELPPAAPPAEASNVVTVALAPATSIVKTREHASTARRSWRWAAALAVVPLAALALFLAHGRAPAPVVPPVVSPPAITPPHVAAPAVEPAPPVEPSPPVAKPNVAKHVSRHHHHGAKSTAKSREIHDPFSER